MVDEGEGLRTDVSCVSRLGPVEIRGASTWSHGHGCSSALSNVRLRCVHQFLGGPLQSNVSAKSCLGNGATPSLEQDLPRGSTLRAVRVEEPEITGGAPA